MNIDEVNLSALQDGENESAKPVNEIPWTEKSEAERAAILEAETEDIFGPGPTKREAEVRDVLNRVGVTREDVSNPVLKKAGALVDDVDFKPSVIFRDYAPPTRDYISPAAEPEPVRDWADDLRDEAQSYPGGSEVPPVAHKPVDLAPISERIAKEFVPAMGQALKAWEPNELGDVLPPAVKVICVKSGLSNDEQREILKNFQGFIQLTTRWAALEAEIVVKDENDKEGMKAAGIFYRKLKDEVNNFEARRKAVKEESLRKGQLIDAIGRWGKELMEPIIESAKQKRDTAKIAEEKRLNEIADDRVNKLRVFGGAYSHATLRGMTDEEFDQIYQNQVTSFNAQQEAEKKAQADAEEKERLRIAENLRLQTEAAEAKQKADDEKARADAEAAKRKEAEDKIALDKAKAEADEKARVEAQEKLAKGPDRDKMQVLADLLESIELLSMTTPAAQAVMATVEADLKAIVKRLRAFE